MSKKKNRLTVKEFLERINKLGYSDDTTISFGCCNYDGEWFDFEIEDGDREFGYDDIGIVFKDNKEYKKNVLEGSNIELEEDLRNIIAKYC